MSTTQKTLIAGSLFLVALVAAAYRYILILPYPMGGGRYVASPDGRYEAQASDLHSEDFWGRSRAWYEFKIVEKTSGRTVASHDMPIPAGATIVSWRSDMGAITWAPDSRSVVFSDGKKQLWNLTVP